MYAYFIMAQRQLTELRSLPSSGQTPTTVYLGDLADKILNHIKDAPPYTSEEITQIATVYSRNPFMIKYDEANNDLLTLLRWAGDRTPGVSLFNKAIKKAMEDHGAGVTKNQIILILCELIPEFMRAGNEARDAAQRLYDCPLCNRALLSWRPPQQHPPPQDEDDEIIVLEPPRNRMTRGGRGRSGLKSHRRTRTRHKSNKKTKQKKRKQKKTKRKKMRRRK